MISYLKVTLKWKQAEMRSIWRMRSICINIHDYLSIKYSFHILYFQIYICECRFNSRPINTSFFEQFIHIQVSKCCNLVIKSLCTTSNHPLSMCVMKVARFLFSISFPPFIRFHSWIVVRISSANINIYLFREIWSSFVYWWQELYKESKQKGN